MTIVRLCAALLFMVAFLCVQACGRVANNAPAATTETWGDVRNALIEDYLKAYPVFAEVAGRHEFGGHLPDWSAAGIAAGIRRLHVARARATAVADAALDEAEHCERGYAVARIDRDLFWLETASWPP